MLMVEVYKTSDELLSIEDLDKATEYIRNGGLLDNTRIVNLENFAIVKENGYNDEKGKFVRSKFGVNIDGDFYTIGKTVSVISGDISRESYDLYQSMVLKIIMNRDSLKPITYIKTADCLFEGLVKREESYNLFKEVFFKYFKCKEEIRENFLEKGKTGVSQVLLEKRDKLKEDLINIMICEVLER